MSLKTQIFYVEKGVGAPQALNDLLSTIPASHIQDLRVLQAHGLTALVLIYEATNFRLLNSSPIDGSTSVAVSSPVFLVFSETFEGVDTATAIAPFLEAYRNGAAVVIQAGDVTVVENRIKISNLVNSTAAAYYQLIIRPGLSAKSKHTFGLDKALTWKTA